MSQRPPYALIIAFVALAYLVSSSDFSLVSVALPSIQRDLALGAGTLSVIVAMNTLTYAGFLILGGRLADLYGPFRCCITGLLLFSAGATCAAFAPSVPIFAAGRALQGLGAAALSPASFALLNTALPEGPWRRRGYGVFASIQAAALIVGYLIGGTVTSVFSWRAAFLINVPPALVAVAIAVVAVPRAPLDPRRGAPDVVGAVLVTAAVTLVVWAISTAGASGWLSLTPLAALAAAAAAFGAFLWLESRLAHPLVPFSIFATPNLIGNDVAMILCMAGGASVFLLPNLYMQQVLGYSAAQSGLGMLPHALGGMLTGRFLVFALRRYSLRANILGGLAACATGLLLFYVLSVLLPRASYLGNILPALLFCAFTTLFAGMVLMAGGTSAVPREQQGVASALALTAMQMGLALGIAVVLTVTGAAQAAGASVVESLREGFLTAAGLIALSGLVILLRTRPYESTPEAAPASGAAQVSE